MLGLKAECDFLVHLKQSKNYRCQFLLLLLSPLCPQSKSCSTLLILLLSQSCFSQSSSLLQVLYKERNILVAVKSGKARITILRCMKLSNSLLGKAGEQSRSYTSHCCGQCMFCWAHPYIAVAEPVGAAPLSPELCKHRPFHVTAPGTRSACALKTLPWIVLAF